MAKLRVLELYCGIGGAHYALQESGIDYEVVTAVDVNDRTNDIYRHNFPDTRILQKSIESISCEVLEKMAVNMIHMSPPCQPFTRVGKQQDNKDRRTDSFFAVLHNIENLKIKPEYITIENVKGFETSVTHDQLIKTLDSCGYKYKEWLLSPIQFGIPNSRLRYYLTAKLTGDFNFETTSQQIITELPECAAQYLNRRVLRQKRNRRFLDGSKSMDHGGDTPLSGGGDTPLARQRTASTTNRSLPDHQVIRHIDSDVEDSDTTTTEAAGPAAEGDGYYVSIKSRTPYTELYKKYQHTCASLMKYLEPCNDEEDQLFTSYCVPDSEFKHLWTMDLVTKDVSHSCCFTKRYGHHVDGAGSILQVNIHSTADLTCFRSQDLQNNEEYKNVCKSLKLRRFSPREISNLMCFPDSFGFPSNFTTIQCYRALGNSLNVHVLSVVIQLMVNC